MIVCALCATRTHESVSPFRSRPNCFFFGVCGWAFALLTAQPWAFFLSQRRVPHIVAARLRAQVLSARAEHSRSADLPAPSPRIRRWAAGLSLAGTRESCRPSPSSRRTCRMSSRTRRTSRVCCCRRHAHGRTRPRPRTHIVHACARIRGRNHAHAADPRVYRVNTSPP
jgi:hypothetical protein